MESIEKKFKIAIFFNTFCALFGIISCVMSYYNDNNLFGCLQFYTVLSNIFAAITSFIWMVFGYYNLGKGNYCVPKRVQNFHFISTCCLFLTFFVVLFVLIPQEYSKIGPATFYRKLFSPVNLWHHLVLPVCSIISISCFEKKPELPFKIVYISLIPTIIYAIVAIILNVLKVLDGPYFFLKVNTQPLYMTLLWCVILFALNFGLNFCLYRLNKIKNH